MNQSIHGYYALHSRIYDLTRWTFLFGRESVLRRIAKISTPQRILEVGCGTGRNLRSLRRIFPHAEITGVDLSKDMLEIARKKTVNVRLVEQAYDAPLGGDYDVVLFSYALSMFNPGWEEALKAARADVKAGGLIVILDFSHTKFGFFRRWMGVNHVHMEGHLWPQAEMECEKIVDQRFPAYFGIWHYGIFIGRV